MALTGSANVGGEEALGRPAGTEPCVADLRDMYTLVSRILKSEF
jgi:hypothetical protein